MKKLIMAAAALTIAVAFAPSQSQAAPDKGPNSEFCKLAKAQRNAPSWNEYYGCMKAPARNAMARAPAPTRASATGPARGPNSEFCKLAKAQRNAPSWNEYYGCMKH
jgi:hypothetical protein